MAAEEPTHSGSVSPMSKLLGDLEIAREYTTGQVRALDLLMMSSCHSCEGCHALCPERILVVDILPSCEGFQDMLFLRLIVLPCVTCSLLP